MLSAVLGFAAAATVVVLLPGPDTLVVVRNLVRGGRRQALFTVAGVLTGLTLWMFAAVVGLAALLRASETGYDVLKLAGACYLLWLAYETFRSRGTPHTVGEDEPLRHRRGLLGSGYGAGLATNLLNPKVGVFYVALLPQFLPSGSNPLAAGLLLAGVHALISVVWFALLILLASALAARLRRPSTVRVIDGITGTTLIGFGVKLAVSR
jgi:threonine/homoserine/homoserine lactone efflux protein